jgi:hypothetical protein
MAKPKERPDYEDRAIQSMASPKEAPFSTHLMQWGGGPAPDQSYLPGTEPKYSAMPTIYPSGDGLIQMEPGLAAAYARDTGEYREFDTPEEAAAYAENGLIDHSPGSLANVEAMRKEGSDHPYSVDNIMSMGYNRNKAEAIYRILNRTVVGGLYPMIGPGAAGRTEAQAAANKKNNKGSTTTKHYVTEPGDPISRFLDDEDTARAIDIKFYKMPVSEWRKQYGPKKDPLGKHLYREDDAAKRIYAEALASEGWGQPTYDEEMLSRGFKPGDWGHAEPIETMRAPKGLYTSRPGFTLSNPVLDTASSKMADAAVTAAMSEKSAKLAQESTKPSEPNDGSDIMPRPQLAGVLQSLADMGYEDDVVEYLTTSQDPSQPIKQRNIAEEMGSAYKTDPMNDGSVKYGVYIPGSGLGKSISEPAAGQVMRRVMSASGHPSRAIHSGGMNSAKVSGEVGRYARWSPGDVAVGGEEMVPVWKARPGERSFSDLEMSDWQKLRNRPPPEGSEYWATDEWLAKQYQKAYGKGSEIDAVTIPKSIIDDLSPGGGQVIIPKRYTK